MMWSLVALLVVLLVGQPLVVAPLKPVAIAAGLAVMLCALGGVTRLAPLFTAGIAVAIAEHALALMLSDGTPHFGTAIGAGVVAMLALDVADFERRFRGVEIGRGVIAGQARYWIGLGAIGAIGSLVLIGLASEINAAARLPWSPIVAAVGAVIVLGAVAVMLRGRESG